MSSNQTKMKIASRCRKNIPLRDRNLGKLIRYEEIRGWTMKGAPFLDLLSTCIHAWYGSYAYRTITSEATKGVVNASMNHNL
ncbi:predicted protein [Sclerotinia sclerotiorum 1980 UF-70]|uniref:Uncharacterized protein n=1 Tax=Sclerotinia sclerotiorum (strain ATCC 18683 / 1980 / Ss-1) TaxID=665079 RepID=A7ED10_SCLS1|nr:predicted protein [Sclerotinia sclerotiorum 1980 UF-70]EDO00726.1 predicted protein [Sclerotinia sclerotiorum 1980 UF-70]